MSGVLQPGMEVRIDLTGRDFDPGWTHDERMTILRWHGVRAKLLRFDNQNPVEMVLLQPLQDRPDANDRTRDGRLAITSPTGVFWWDINEVRQDKITIQEIPV